MSLSDVICHCRSRRRQCDISSVTLSAALPLTVYVSQHGRDFPGGGVARIPRRPIGFAAAGGGDVAWLVWRVSAMMTE